MIIDIVLLITDRDFKILTHGTRVQMVTAARHRPFCLLTDELRANMTLTEVHDVYI